MWATLVEQDGIDCAYRPNQRIVDDNLGCCAFLVGISDVQPVKPVLRNRLEQRVEIFAHVLWHQPVIGDLDPVLPPRKAVKAGGL